MLSIAYLKCKIRVILLSKGPRIYVHRGNVQERNVFHAGCMLSDCAMLSCALLL